MYVTSIKIYKKTKQNNYMVKTKNPQSIKKINSKLTEQLAHHTTKT